jgi:hypothetical protein
VRMNGNRASARQTSVADKVEPTAAGDWLLALFIESSGF